MIIISHRSNLNGSDSSHENDPEQIQKILDLKFDVKIDVWFAFDNFFLGNESAIYKIDEKFLENEKLWCHARNIEALEKMLFNEKIHCFWQEKDKLTITNKNLIWLQPTEKTKFGYPSIITLPESIEKNIISPTTLGVCTDYPMFYKALLK